ncbi:MAG: hypothetical protein H5U21_10060 [Porphyrobacter sp.]|nr:hypothetical protein [Porphyrobacter sp.]
MIRRSCSPRVRQICWQREERYGIDASPDLISASADAVRGAVAEWQERPRFGRPPPPESLA